MVDNEDSYCVYVFLSCHTGLVDGFYRCIVIRGVCKANTFPSRGLGMSQGAKDFVLVVGGVKLCELDGTREWG